MKTLIQLHDEEQYEAEVVNNYEARMKEAKRGALLHGSILAIFAAAIVFILAWFLAL